MPDLTFGKRTGHTGSSSGGAFEYYLKYFKEAQTRLTVLDPNMPGNSDTDKGNDSTPTWMKYREHYDHALKLSYPCAVDAGGEECCGCSYPVEHPEYSDLDTYFPDGTYSEKIQARKKADKGWGVRDASPKWILPAIDPDGYVSLFKLGKSVRDDFQTQFEVLGSLMNNEWVVTKKGSMLNTEYGLVAVPGEVREPKFAIPGDAEISSVLGSKYAKALEAYGYDVPAAPQPDPAPAWDPNDDSQDEAQAQVPDTGAQADTNLTAQATNTGELFVPREASTGEIKDWLTTNKVTFKATEARSQLISLAEKKLVELAPF